MKLNHMVSRRNHLLNIVDTFWYYSAFPFRSSVRGVIPSSSDAITCTEGNNSGLSQSCMSGGTYHSMVVS